jgi:hypothetical protein
MLLQEIVNDATKVPEIHEEVINEGLSDEDKSSSSEMEEK